MPILSESSLQIHLLTLDKVYMTTPLYVIIIEVDNVTHCVFITGSPPSKVYGHMRAVAGKLSERF